MKKFAAIWVVSVPLVAMAGPNLLVDGSFEQGAYVPGADAAMSLPVSDTAVSGWVVVSDFISWFGAGNPYGLSASDGLKFLDLTDTQAGAPYGGVQQTINTTIGQSYILTFDVGSSSPYGLPAGVRATAGNSSQDYVVSLPGTNVWTPFSLNFVATSATTAITLTGVAGTYYTGLDNIGVSAVPEAPWYMTMAPGLAIVAFLSLRRKRKFEQLGS